MRPWPRPLSIEAPQTAGKNVFVLIFNQDTRQKHLRFHLVVDRASLVGANISIMSDSRDRERDGEGEGERERRMAPLAGIVRGSAGVGSGR